MTKLTTEKQFNALWLAETVRIQEEEQGAFADNEAIRQAKKQSNDLQTRILIRAQYLAEKTKLITAQKACITAMHWSTRLLLLFAFFVGIGLVLPTFSATEHTINIFTALGCLLGLNFIMLIVWLVGTFVGGQSINQLGKFGLWLTSKLTGKKQVIQLIPALLSLLHQKRLERWWLGRLTNGLWLIASIVALLSLLLLLATQRYGFIWQTTILSADSFVSIVHVLGALPNALGFPTPSEEIIRLSGDSPIMTDSARQVWAAWLVGVLITYGILPRLCLFLLCHIFWRYGYQRLSLDLNLPSYHLLKTRLQPDSELIGVTDSTPKDWIEPSTVSGIQGFTNSTRMIMGIELESNYPWPPAISEKVYDAGIIETREQRKQLLEQLTSQSIAKLLIVCDPKRSVDRGTLALISELAHCAKETRVCLLMDESTDSQRLADWQHALAKLQLTYGDQDKLLAWLRDENE